MSEVKNRYPSLTGDLIEKYGVEMVYELHPSLATDVPIYKRDNLDATGTGPRIIFNDAYPLPIQCNFIDKDNNRRITRYIPESLYIDQQPQVEIEKHDINRKIPNGVRDKMKISPPTLTISDAYTNWWLSKDNCPFIDDFTGKDRGTSVVLIKRKDVEKENKDEFELMGKQAQIATKILAMSKEDLFVVYTTLFGVSHSMPEVENKAKTDLVKLVADVPLRIDYVLSYKSGTVLAERDGVKVMLSKLEKSGDIQFDPFNGHIKLMKKGQYETVKEISSIDYVQQQELFVDYLLSEEGKSLKGDLNKITLSKKL